MAPLLQLTPDSKALRPSTPLPVRAEDCALRLLAYCRAENWSGYDPYDGLNSRFICALPVLNFRLARLCWIQGFKKCPVNLRPLFLVPKTQNPKALALFLSATLKLSELGLLNDRQIPVALASRLAALRSPDSAFWCWGYSFPWQTRTVLVPRQAPNLVCTVFVAQALLDLFEARREERWLEMALSAGKYLLELYHAGDGIALFSYPNPECRSPIHNANLLSAALLARLSACSGQQEYLDPALQVARHTAGQQRDDGSWPYGETKKQSWIDNFHTGFNLCALRDLATHAATSEFDDSLKRGLEFYRKHFFREDGAPKYFHDQVYPIDAHSAAQSIITLAKFRELSPENFRLARKVLSWSLAHLWDERGFFYYQQRKGSKVKIPYIRWAQAWMLLAVATILQQERAAAASSENKSAALVQALAA